MLPADLMFSASLRRTADLPHVMPAPAVQVACKGSTWQVTMSPMELRGQ